MDDTGLGPSGAPASTVVGRDTEPDGALAVYGVDIVRQGSTDYLVFASASGATVPVVKASDKWELYIGSGSATWTNRTVTLAASDTGRAEITAGLSGSQRTAFQAAQDAGAIMAARPVETHDGATAVWYVEFADFGDRESLRFRLWERAGTSGTWGTARATGTLPSDAKLPAAVSVTTADNPVERYATCSHLFRNGAGTSDGDLTVRYRSEFIRHMNYTRI